MTQEIGTQAASTITHTKTISSPREGSIISTGNQAGTGEVLFLKRLLFLKASIDNESTLNTFSVPFEQEKMRDVATESKLMIKNEGVASGF
jgi:hypothetical protein